MGRKSIYSNEFKQSVVEFFKSHTTKETAKEFSLTESSVSNFAHRAGYKKGQEKHPISFKHEVCQFYDNNTWDETICKFGVSAGSLFKWRKELGYRNKSRGYNLHTEGLQPTVTKRERHDFMVTRSENGQLKAELQQRDERITSLEERLTQLEGASTIISQLKQLLN